MVLGSGLSIGALDKFDGGADDTVDTIQIGAAGAGVTVNLSGAATNGTLGFLGFEALSFANTSTTSTATFSSGSARPSVTFSPPEGRRWA